jgi:Uma2 family endonuclease
MSASEDHVKRRLLNVDEYHSMGVAGILKPEERVELIEGEIIEMAPIGAAHAGWTARLNYLLQSAVGEEALVWVQNSVRLSRNSEPEPDLALLYPRKDFYADALPEASDVLLIIEVAQSSLRYDQDRKLPLYARHAIPEVWLLDIEAKALTQYSKPTDFGYDSVCQLEQPWRLAPSLFPQALIDLSAVFEKTSD